MSCSTRGRCPSPGTKAASSQQLFNPTPHEQFKYPELFRMRKLKWLKGTKSLLMKHEYFISKNTNETKHSHNISSAGIKYSLLPHGKPNLSHHNFNPKYECLRWCSKDKEVSVKYQWNTDSSLQSKAATEVHQGKNRKGLVLSKDKWDPQLG